MPLKDLELRAAKYGVSKTKLSDGGGLYLHLAKSGSKLWRMKFRIHGKEKLLSFGPYPEVSLKEARHKRDRARLELRDGIDPAKTKREKKRLAKMGSANSFKAIGEEYLIKVEKDGLAPVTISKKRWLFGKLAPSLGVMPIKDVGPHDLLAVLKDIEAAGTIVTAHRARSFAGQIFRYAIATGRAEADPTFALRGALITPQVKHLAAITDPKELGALLRAIDGYPGRPATNLALRVTPHIFQRPGEIRQMEWSELDFEKGIWTIQAEKMKQRVAHKIPLSRQSVSFLEEMKALDMSDRYVFPALGKPLSPMSENAIVGALRRLGYGGEDMTAHGFRTTASTLLNESGKWNPDAIERALSHIDRNQVRAIYNRGAYWDERVKMAQWWSDYLDRLKVEPER